MDRTYAYPGQQPTDTLWLTTEKNKMMALGYLIQGAFGTNTVVDGLTCAPTSPASLAVTISNGSIYQQEPADVTNYGTLAADPLHQIIKQGIAQDIPNITLLPPGTSGQAINYLIQAQFSELDTAFQALPYFNSNQIVGQPVLPPFSGPNGSGTSQPTIRQGTININALAGNAAIAGTQVTPAPLAGYVGLWVVTVANGATQLTSAQISMYPNAPFIAVKLPAVPSYIQSGVWEWGASDTGTANQVIVNISPFPATITAGCEIKFQKIGTQSNGPMTIIVNGAPAVTLTNVDGSAFSATAFMPANALAVVTYNGTVWRWTNSTIATATGNLNAAAGEGIAVAVQTGNAVISLNYASLTDNPNPSVTVDLWSFFNSGTSHHRVLNSAEFLAWLRLNLPITILTAPQTYYVNSAIGNDNNNGTSAATPFATIQKAISASQGFNLNGFSVTINLANGTYAPFSTAPVNGAGTVSIIGNASTPSSVVIHATAGEAAAISNPQYTLSGMTFQSDAAGGAGHIGAGLRVDAPVAVSDVQFNACQFAHINISSTGALGFFGAAGGFPGAFYTIAGSAQFHINNTNGVVATGSTILNILPGTYQFTTFINTYGGVIATGGPGTMYSTINNSGTVLGRRFSVGGFGSLLTSSGGNLNYFPGNTPGIIQTTPSSIGNIPVGIYN